MHALTILDPVAKRVTEVRELKWLKEQSTLLVMAAICATDATYDFTACYQCWETVVTATIVLGYVAS